MPKPHLGSEALSGALPKAPSSALEAGQLRGNARRAREELERGHRGRVVGPRRARLAAPRAGLLRGRRGEGKGRR